MTQFELNLSLVLSHSIVLDVKDFWSPNGIVDDARNGGDKAPDGLGHQVASILNTYNTNLPKLVQTTANSILPMENAQLGAAQQVSPAYAALFNQIDAANKLASGQSDLAALNDSGTQLATKQQDIDKLLNPEFYQSRASENQGYQDLLKAYNPNNPMPEAERAINLENARSGNLNNNNATTTVSNAMAFGDERMKRAQLFGNTLQSMTSFLQPSKSSFDPFGRTNTTNFNTSGANNVGSNTMNMGQNLLGTTAAVNAQNQQINSQRRDTLDRVNETMSAEPISD